MDILAVLPLCTDKISDLLRSRQHKGTNKKLNLLIGMLTHDNMVTPENSTSPKVWSP